MQAYVIKNIVGKKDWKHKFILHFIKHAFYMKNYTLQLFFQITLSLTIELITQNSSDVQYW